MFTYFTNLINIKLTLPHSKYNGILCSLELPTHREPVTHFRTRITIIQKSLKTIVFIEIAFIS